MDAETAPLREPEHYQYDFNLADVAEVWRRGSVVASWLLDLTAISLSGTANSRTFSGRVSDSGEGRWTIHRRDRIHHPRPVLSAALYQRFTRRAKTTSPEKFFRHALSVRRTRREKVRPLAFGNFCAQDSHRQAGQCPRFESPQMPIPLAAPCVMVILRRQRRPHQAQTIPALCNLARTACSPTVRHRGLCSTTTTPPKCSARC